MKAFDVLAIRISNTDAYGFKALGFPCGAELISGIAFGDGIIRGGFYLIDRHIAFVLDMSETIDGVIFGDHDDNRFNPKSLAGGAHIDRLTRFEMRWGFVPTLVLHMSGKIDVRNVARSPFGVEGNVLGDGRGKIIGLSTGGIVEPAAEGKA